MVDDAAIERRGFEEKGEVLFGFERIELTKIRDRGSISTGRAKARSRSSRSELIGKRVADFRNIDAPDCAVLVIAALIPHREVERDLGRCRPIENRECVRSVKLRRASATAEV